MQLQQKVLLNLLVLVLPLLYGTTTIAEDLLITHENSLYSGSQTVDFGPHGNYIATGDIDGDVGFWEVGSDEAINFKSLGGDVQGVAFSPDGRYLAADGYDDNVQAILLDVATRTIVRSRNIDDNAGNINAVAYSPNGNYVAVAVDLRWAYLWELSSGNVFGWGKSNASEVYDVAFSPDGKYLATGNDNGDLTLWELDSWWMDDVNLIDYKPGGNVQSVAFSPDGRYLAADGYDGNNTYVNIYSLSTGRVVWQINSGDVYTIAFSPNGEYLALGDDAATITFYRIDTNVTQVGEITANDTVHDLAWHPDGTLISDGRDVWNVTQSSPPVETPVTTPKSDTIVSLSPTSVQSPDIGEQLTLSLEINNGENAAGYQATVSYDTSALRYVSSESGDYLPAGAFFVPPIVAGNTVTLAATSLTGESNGDGTLATLTFEVVSVKTSTLTLSNVLLTDSAGVSSRPEVETTQITESGPSSDRIGVTLPSDFISEVAFGANSTYFVLNAQFPTLTGIENTDVSYRVCTITLDLPDVPANSLSDNLVPDLLVYLPLAEDKESIVDVAKGFSEKAGLFDVFPDEPQYFMFPLVTATEISDEAQAATYRQLLAAEGALFIGLIPTAGSLLNFGITVGSVLYNRIIAIDEILKSRMDPKIALDAWGSARDATPRWRNPGRPDNQLRYVLIFPKRVTEIGVTLEQVYMLKSD